MEINRHKKTILFTTVIFLFAHLDLLHAQQKDSVPNYTLEEIWKIAETNNHQLKLSDLNLRQSQLEILEAKDRLLPELSIVGDVKLNSRFLIYNNGLFASPQEVPVKGYGYGVGYSFNFDLFNGGKEKRNIQIKQEENIRRQYEVNLQMQNIKYTIAVAYFGLFKLLKFRDFICTEIDAEKKQLSLIESLYNNGIVLKSDVLRTSVKLSQLELNLSDIKKKIDLATHRLNIYMGRDVRGQLKIPYQQAINTDIVIDSDYTDYMDIAFSQSPEYKIADSDNKLSELNIKQVKATLFPRVSLYSNYNYTYPQISFYPYSKDLWGFGQTGIKMQFSIDNLHKNKHAVARVRMIDNQVKEKIKIKKDEISIQVKEAYLQRLQAMESLAMAEKNIVESKETVRVIKNSYLNQESLLTDLLEAENALLEAKFNLITAQADLKLSHIRLLAITGIL
ncbi:Outer membrane protein TolC [Sinomicrobium oceani]|uniref:Outer membrane protein TolC n=1 Tax=Sinomicrobium oceani TaxID=1150368 RepID=A0A1K1RRI6_9FLAO|nr:TolC family protein [Sinomicrobium oceani]SFW74359.1 Outer membrane protein TolC [Sinomicrobium oceani]